MIEFVRIVSLIICSKDLTSIIDHVDVFSGMDSDLDMNPRQAEAFKKRKVSGVDHAILKCLKHLDDKQPRVLDEEELFGMHIAAILRRLTNRQKAMARLRIQQVLTDVEFPETSHPT